jgi:ATP-dependent helicase/nuclease subunit B
MGPTHVHQRSKKSTSAVARCYCLSHPRPRLVMIQRHSATLSRTLSLTPPIPQFLGWTDHALPAASALLADAYATADSIALQNVAVALPGARAGRRVKELLVAEAERRGLRLVPPQVVTVGALPELLYTPTVALADAELCRRLWLRQLSALPEAERVLLFPRAPAPDDLRGWFGLADAVVGLQRAVGAAGLRFNDVAERCVQLHDDSSRWNVLAEMQQRVTNELQARGCIDRDHARILAVTERRVTSGVDVWLVGVAEMPVITRRMLQRVAPERLRILVHAPRDMAEAFDELGCVRPDYWARAEIELEDDQISIVSHPSGQAREAAAVVARLDGEYAADEIVIGVPDAEVVPTLEREFASAGVATRYLAGEGDERSPEFRLLTAGIPARYAAGVPIERTAPFRLLQALADVLREHSYEAAAALVRHPAFGDWLGRRRWQIEHPGAAAFKDSDGWLAQLDTFLCERVPYTITGDMGGDGGRGRAVAEALRTALLGGDMLGGLAGERPLRGWMRVLLALMLEIYGERSLHRHVRDEQRLLAFASRLRDAANTFERVPLELDEECDAATAIQLVLDAVAGDALPPDADDVAVELLGWLELHLDDAPVAILTGMNEPFVPEAVNADAFLPNALRALLGIEDNERRYARDAYQLTAMLRSRRVFVIAGRRTLLGDPLRPSRLLLATSGSTLARRIRSWLRHTDTAPAAAGEAGASRFALPPQPRLSLDPVPASLSVTEFGAIISDPYGWALAYTIDGDVVDDAQRELDPMRFGTLAHRVLEAFGRTPAAASDDIETVTAALDDCLDTYVARNYGAVFPAVRLQVEQLRLRLRAFARCQAQRVADGWRTVAVEYGTPDGGVPLPFDAEFRVKGRIDRIDHHVATGRWAVFDYKTGERGEAPDEIHRKKDNWIDLQLPLYRHILPHVVDREGNRLFTGDEFSGRTGAGADAGNVVMGYILLCGNPHEIRFAEAAWTQDELKAAMDAARDVVACVRRNMYEFPGFDSGWYTDDMAELLGRGRLVLEDDDVVEDVAL